MKSKSIGWSSDRIVGGMPNKSILGKLFRKQVTTLTKFDEVVKVIKKHKK